MPPVKGKLSGPLAKLGDRVAKAHAKAKDKETEYGNMGDLPTGINGGVAQLTDIKIDTVKPGKKNEGQPIFMASGVVVSPKTFNGMVVEGMRTSIITVLCDTPERKGERRTFEDHYDWMLNELRKLGVDTSGITHNDLDGVFETLRETKPYFRFRTWGGPTEAYPDGRVNHEWSGVVDAPADAAGEDNGGGMEDGTQSSEPEAAAEEEGDDLVALGGAADNGDTDAETRLTELATAEGVTDEQIAGATNWSALAEMIQKVRNGESLEESAAWKVGDMCQYAPKDPKDKTGAKRLAKVQCKILKVDGTEVDLQNMADTKKKYLKVSVNEIETA